MGLEMLGLVEVYRNGFWAGTLKTEPLVTGQNYNMYANLFGITNDEEVFEPVVGMRGIPQDASDLARRELALFYSGDGDSRFDSWISWDEIAGIDWGQLQGRPFDSGWPSRSEVENGDWLELQTLNKEHRVTRGYALSWEWEMLFEIMKILAEKLGGSNVRLVAWFMR